MTIKEIHNPGLSATKRELLELLLNEKREKAKAAPAATGIPRRRPGEPVPAAFAQQRLWFLDQLEPGSAAYNIPAAVRLIGDLDRDRLERAVNEVVKRHEDLRTTFTAVDGRPLQEIAAERHLPLAFEDLSGEDDPERVALRRVAEEAGRPFDLARGPLLRVTLFRLGEGDHVLLKVVHHIISDVWSIGLFFREMTAVYQALATGRPVVLPELPIQYGDYAVWQRGWLQGEESRKQLAYWKKQLTGAPAVLDLPADRPRPPLQTFRGARRPLRLSAGLMQSLQAFGQGIDASLFMVLQAALAMLLQRYTGQEDVLTGTPMANRTRVELEKVIGFFVNMLVLRTDLSGDPTFTELAGRVREVMLAAYASHDLPLETVLEELQLERDPSRNPLFQVSFAFQNAPVPPLEAPGLTIRPFEIQERTSRFDLELDLREVGDGYGGWFGFNSDLFELATIERMAGHFEVLLTRAAAEPGRRISELSPLSDAEERQLLVGWNTLRSFPADATLHGLFERQAAATPQAVAVSFEDQELTYGELAGRAESLARHLRSLGVGPEVLVGLCLERSPEMVVGLLAVLKAGGAYLPLDPDYPRERLAFMLADSGAAVLLTRTGLELPETSARTVYVDQEWEAVAAESAGGGSSPLGGGGLDQGGGQEGGGLLEGNGPPSSLTLGPAPLLTSPLSQPPPAQGGGTRGSHPPARPGNLAYVIYTSGSTGRPKGVQIPHANVVRLFSSTQDWFGFGPSDVWTLFHSYAFDFSVWEIWGALLHGGRLVVVPYFVSRSPEAFAELLAREKVTVLNQTPSAFRQLVQADSRRGGESLALRHVIFGGEALELQSLRPWLDRSDLQGGDERPRLVNMYGITETTVHVTYRPVRAADLERPAASPIGERIPDLQLFLLDRRLQPAPLGVPGEIFVGGAGLARGYLARPELTAERFVPHPFGTSGERLYRSGDQARFRPDGDLEYLGRIDQQVKVRGFRIETGEIEAALARVPAVRECAVLARQDIPGDTRLVAYVVGEGTDVSTLRAALQERLPDYMVPSAFVFLPALPLNANGKVDRKALPAPESARPELASEYVAPRTAVEVDLARIWAEVLGVERIGVYDSFFELGGQSLLATQVASRLREVFGVELPLRALFQQPTLEGLAGSVEAASAAGPARQAPPLVPVSRDAAGIEMPLSFGQERLWFIDQLVPDLTAYNIPGAVRMRGRLVLPALEASVTEIMRRHEVLRTTFKDAEGRPVQVFHEPWPFRIPEVDLRALPEPLRSLESDRLANGTAERGFDLANGPLLRILLLHLGEDDHRMALVLHHIVYDMWSREIFLRELATLYTAFSRGLPSPLPEPVLQYADFAHWQRLWFQGEVMEEQLGYWRNALANLPAALELPTDRPRPPFQTFRGTRAFLHLTPELTAAAHGLAQREGVTLFIALLTVYYALLFRYTGQADLPVGSPIANRNRLELEELMGFFANTLVLRADLSGGITFREALGRVREVAFGAYANQDLAFEQLVNDLQPERDLGRQPLFQVMFNVVQNYVPPAMALPDLTISPEWIHGGEVQFDFTLSLWESDGCLRGALDYSTELFDEPTVVRMLGHYGNLLESAAADPAHRLGGLRLLDEAEQQQIRVEWNDSAAPLLPHASYAELFAAAAARHPDAVALTEFVDAGDAGEEIRYTFRELDERAGRWARRIAALGSGPDRIVALLSRRGADLVTAIVAVLKSGAAYLPLDPGHPARRHAQILSQSGAILVLSAEDLVPVVMEAMPEVPEEARPRVLSLRDLETGEMEEAESLAAAGPENLAYVIYTSGSTGLPKGVMLRQEGLLNHLLGKVEMLGLGSGHTVAQNASQCFDISVWQMLGPLATGGRVHVYPDEVAHDPARLLDRAEADGVTILEVVPSLLRAMLDESELRPAERRPAFAALQWVLPTGEALPPDLCRRWLTAYPEVPLVNAYGPTECSDDVSLAFLRQPAPEGAARMSIGRPVVNLRLYVMDRELTGVAIGVGGELCVSGVGVGRGYRNDPARTASVFVPDPFSGIHTEPGARMYRSGDLARTLPDGSLEFLGRIDHQVKVRGFRIELGEIEAVLALHPAVREVAVLARSAEGESTTASFLAAYLVDRDEAAPVDDRELREYLRVRLPEYMMPSVFVRLSALPLTPNGKLDRRALLQLGVTAPEPQEEHVAPRTPVEERLAAIWSEVLGRERVSVTASFFELGGHSLLVTQVVSRLRAAFGVEMPLRTMFEAPTVAALAERVETLLWVARPPQVAVPAGAMGEEEEEGEL